MTTPRYGAVTSNAIEAVFSTIKKPKNFPALDLLTEKAEKYMLYNKNILLPIVMKKVEKNWKLSLFCIIDKKNKRPSGSYSSTRISL
ncbi:hypothetical protein BB558_002602 [Smittium angustum]|uniref:Uncharacterized protein n=1 Tax=Smittium angustum TaxID=133377 RepID=A0A2U1J8A7_SMIAN|nr:hypothetical protein BB558_002602 [Smittium angustum]